MKSPTPVSNSVFLILALVTLCTVQGEDPATRAHFESEFPSCAIIYVTQDEGDLSAAITTTHYPFPYPGDLDECYVLYNYERWVGIWITDVDMECGSSGIDIKEVHFDLYRNSITEDRATGLCNIYAMSEDERTFLNDVLYIRFRASETTVTKRGAMIHYARLSEEHIGSHWRWWRILEYFGALMFIIPAGICCLLKYCYYRKQRARNNAGNLTGGQFGNPAVQQPGIPMQNQNLNYSPQFASGNTYGDPTQSMAAPPPGAQYPPNPAYAAPPTYNAATATTIFVNQ